MFPVSSDVAYDTAYGFRALVLHHQIAGFLQIIASLPAGPVAPSAEKPGSDSVFKSYRKIRTKANANNEVNTEDHKTTE